MSVARLLPRAMWAPLTLVLQMTDRCRGERNHAVSRHFERDFRDAK